MRIIIVALVGFNLVLCSSQNENNISENSKSSPTNSGQDSHSSLLDSRIKNENGTTEKEAHEYDDFPTQFNKSKQVLTCKEAENFLDQNCISNQGMKPTIAKVATIEKPKNQLLLWVIETSTKLAYKHYTDYDGEVKKGRISGPFKKYLSNDLRFTSNKQYWVVEHDPDGLKQSIRPLDCDACDGKYLEISDNSLRLSDNPSSNWFVTRNGNCEILKSDCGAGSLCALGVDGFDSEKVHRDKAAAYLESFDSSIESDESAVCVKVTSIVFDLPNN